PGIAAGSILVFVTVIKETSISILMAPAEWAPMSLAIFQNILRAEYYSAAAMSMILIVLVMVFQGVANFFTRKQSTKDHGRESIQCKKDLSSIWMGRFIWIII